MSYHERTTKETPHPPKVEHPGTVLSDSLAAESASQGGSFASNTNPTILSQSAASTTANTTDTSAATTLPPAPDAEARLASDQSSESATLNAGAGSGSKTGSGAYNTTTSQANSAAAPSYVNAGADGGRPAGKNLTEGGFSSDTPNASFGTKIGGGGDPGRVALGEFERRNAEPGDSIGREGEGKSGNAFEELARDEAA